MTEEQETTTEFGLKPALIGVAISAAILTVGAFALFDARTGLGVLIGGSIATANLWVMTQVAKAFIAQKGRTAPWAVIAALKLLLLVLGVWLLLRSGTIPPLALIVGYAALPFGITVGSLFAKPPPEENAPAPVPIDDDTSGDDLPQG
jgi:hypothetical protein